MKPRLVFPAASSSTETVVCSFSRSKDISGRGYKVCNPNPNQGADVLSGDFQQEWFGDGGGGRCPRMLDTEQWEVTHWSLSVQRGG